MTIRTQLLAGFLCCLPLSAVLAEPPHFTTSDEAIGIKAAPVVSPLVSEAAPALGNPASTPSNDPAAAQAVTESKSASTSPQTASTTSTSSKPASIGNWFTRLFRPKPATTMEVTRKPDGALANTEMRHKDVPDLLESADLYHYEPGMDIRWQVMSSNVMCRMTQRVPHFGTVEFRQGAVQPLEFVLYVDHPPGGVGVVQVTSEPARWQHYVKKKRLGALKLESGDYVFTAPVDWSRRLFLELSEGMQPAFHFWDAADAGADIEIYLSALAFDASLDQFRQCLGQLLRYDFKQVQLNVLHFNPDSSKMLTQTYQQLDEVLETLKVDKGIGEVNLEIYTQKDALEHYNFRLASRRAQTVRDYLIKHDVKEDMIFIKIHTMSKDQITKLGYNVSDVYIELQRGKQQAANSVK